MAYIQNFLFVKPKMKILHLLALRLPNKATSSMWAKKQIYLNAKNVSGKTAFQMATENGNSEMIQLLLQKSTELNIDVRNI